MKPPVFLDVTEQAGVGYGHILSNLDTRDARERDRSDRPFVKSIALVDSCVVDLNGDTRTTPPVGHDDLALDFSKWMHDGAPCPTEIGSWAAPG
jgi:hypothetical protein